MLKDLDVRIETDENNRTQIWLNGEEFGNAVTSLKYTHKGGNCGVLTLKLLPTRISIKSQCVDKVDIPDKVFEWILRSKELKKRNREVKEKSAALQQQH